MGGHDPRLAIESPKLHVIGSIPIPFAMRFLGLLLILSCKVVLTGTYIYSCKVMPELRQKEAGWNHTEN